MDIAPSSPGSEELRAAFLNISHSSVRFIEVLEFTWLSNLKAINLQTILVSNSSRKTSYMDDECTLCFIDEELTV